jgi:SAM-dependent methyltransferase
MTELPINSTAAIRAAWDSRVEDYSDMLADAGRRAVAAAAELAAFEAHLPASTILDILDAGCGPGFHSRRLLAKGHRVTFADVSPEMLKQARRSIPEEAASRATFLEADIRDLAALPAAHFDAAISGGTVISDCGDPYAAVAEISRVLKSHGLLGFSVRNLDGPQQRGARQEVIRGGGPGFDWWFFSTESVRELCSGSGLVCRRTYPILMDPEVPVPHEDEWHAAAWEMFVIAAKERTANKAIEATS